MATIEWPDFTKAGYTKEGDDGGQVPPRKYVPSEIGGTVTEERKLCPFSMAGGLVPLGCREEECMAWQPEHREIVPNASGSLYDAGIRYMRQGPGRCRLIP